MPIDKSSFSPSTFKLVKENYDNAINGNYDIAINGKIENLNDKTIVFIPQDVLDPDTKYTAKISKEIKSIQGLGLKNEKNWSFRTLK